MTLEDFKKIVSILRALGIREIDVLGGEPFLHRDIIPMLGTASDNFESIFISTNGRAIDLMKSIKRLFPRINIGISLNSEPGRALREFIVEHRPLLKSVVHKRYFIPPWMEDFLRMGLSCYVIFRDVIHRHELKEIKPFYEFLREVDMWVRLYPQLRPVYCGGFISDGAQGGRCPAGSTKLSIMPDGSVFPCYLFFRFPEFRLGSILDTEIDEILREPIFDFFKQPANNNCKVSSCHIRTRCNGGCPAVSYAIYGNLNMPDPRCLPG
jgi:radical SAM protein with 4Fe4S-binding SPASM domain